MWPYLIICDWVFSLASLLKSFPEGTETKEAAEKGQSHLNLYFFYLYSNSDYAFLPVSPQSADKGSRLRAYLILVEGIV